MTQKEQLDAATTRVTALEGELATASQTISTLEAAKLELTTRAESAETKVTDLTTAAGTHAAAIAEKDSTISTLTTRAETAETEAKELKDKATTVDAAADSKAREIAARNGADLPAKQPGAGDQTTTNAGKPAGSARDRLASHINAQFPAPTPAR